MQKTSPPSPAQDAEELMGVSDDRVDDYEPEFFGLEYSADQKRSEGRRLIDGFALLHACESDD